MESLRGRDIRAALDFVETAWASAGEHAFTLETLDALGTLIRSDFIAYNELDRVHQRAVDDVSTDAQDGEDDDGLFWRIVEEHPLCRHQQAYADFSATRLSDVISQRRLHNSRVYAEWFHPLGIECELEVGIARSRTQTRNFILDRASGDFSLRDRALLELVRPHLCRIQEMTALRQEVGRPDLDEPERLTTREAEILELVAAGLTNAAIAERLWVSPGTVKKHLENIYAKLGVANRTAAAQSIRPHQ